MNNNENTGYYNSGDRNSGNWNSGDYNSGNYNSGDRNSVDRNSGDRNSGNRNSGDRNSGNRNSGDWNSCDYNSGNFNSGDYNSGSHNSGNFNSGNYNSGSFNRDCPKMRLFEKELDMTVEEFYRGYDIYMELPLNTWVDKDNMTEDEKSEVSGWETMGGYLKTLEYKEACQKWWSDNPDDHERFLTLPGFDAEIFKDITGIDVDNQETIEIAGKKYSKQEFEQATKNLKEL